jgi:hypothetical protein
VGAQAAGPCRLMMAMAQLGMPVSHAGWGNGWAPAMEVWPGVPCFPL